MFKPSKGYRCSAINCNGYSAISEYPKGKVIELYDVVTLAEEIGLHTLHTYPCKYCPLLLFKENISKVFGCELVIR